MPARIVERYGKFVVHAAPRGTYGFGTIGLATPERMFNEAWRMVRRAGLENVTNRESARIMLNFTGEAVSVEFDLVPGADLSAVPSRAKAY